MGNVVCFLNKKVENLKIRIQEYKWICIGLGISLYFLIRRYQFLLDRMARGTRQIQGLGIGFSLMMIFIVVLLVGILILKYEMLKEEKEALSMHDSVIEEKYREMLKNQQLVHDMKNHFLAMEKYVKEENWRKLGEYIKSIGGELLNANPEKWTGNTIIDFIISQKKREAEQQNICVDIDVPTMLEIPLADNEIIALFGNLFDNAIEACVKIKKDEKRIGLRIIKQKEMVYIEIKNNIEAVPQKRLGEYITTKKDSCMHGYGIKSIKEIVERHQGNFFCDIQNNRVFKVDIVFFDNGDIRGGKGNE